MDATPALDLLVRDVARARDIRTVQALANTLGVAWRTAGDLWDRSAQRLTRRVLAAACVGLSCQPYHLLRLVDTLAPPNQARLLDPLPPLGCHPGGLQVVLRIKEIAQADYAVADISALARHVGLAWDTAADLWYDRIQVFDRTVFARCISALGGPAALERLIIVEHIPVLRGDVTHREAGLAVPG